MPQEYEIYDSPVRQSETDTTSRLRDDVYGNNSFSGGGRDDGRGARTDAAREREYWQGAAREEQQYWSRYSYDRGSRGNFGYGQDYGYERYERGRDYVDAARYRYEYGRQPGRVYERYEPYYEERYVPNDHPRRPYGPPHRENDQGRYGWRDGVEVRRGYEHYREYTPPREYERWDYEREQYGRRYDGQRPYYEDRHYGNCCERRQPNYYDRGRDVDRQPDTTGWRDRVGTPCSDDFRERLAPAIRRMLGHSITEYDRSIPPNLGCARFVSAALERAYGLPIKDATVVGLERSLQRHGWEPVPLDQLQPGDVIIGMRGRGEKNHAAIYVGNGEIANNNSVTKEIQIDSVDKFNHPSFVTRVAYRRRC